MEKLIRIRKSCDAFDTHAEQKVLQEEKELFSYIRNGKTKRVLCLHNFSEKEIEKSGIKGTDLWTGEKVNGVVKILPYGFKWIIL